MEESQQSSAKAGRIRDETRERTATATEEGRGAAWALEIARHLAAGQQKTNFSLRLCGY